MEGKNSNIIYLLVGVLLACVVGLGGFIVYDKVLSNNNSNSNNNSSNNEPTTNDSSKEEVKDLSLDDTIVQALAARVIGVYTNAGASDYYNYFYKKDSIYMQNEDMKLKLSLASRMIESKFKRGEFDEKTEHEISYIDEESIKNAYYEMFGKNASYTRSTFSIGDDCIEYKWSNNNNRYEADLYYGCGGVIGGEEAYSKLGYAKNIKTKEEDKIELYEYFIYRNVEGIYSDLDAKNKIEFKRSDDSEKDAEELFKSYKDQLGLYKYTFVKDSNGTYVFTSVNREK